MFIFSRPFRAVAAGLGVALLTVRLDRACETPDGTPAARPATVETAHPPPPARARPGAGRDHQRPAARLCHAVRMRYRRRRFVTFPFPAACRPPLRPRVGFRV